MALRVQAVGLLNRLDTLINIYIYDLRRTKDTYFHAEYYLTIDCLVG